MKNQKTFSLVILTLISYFSYAQENSKDIIATRETPAIIFKSTTINSPVILIDGIISNDSILRTIDPENILSINVSRDTILDSIYRKEGRNKVIIIKTKTFDEKKSQNTKKNSKKTSEEKNKNTQTN